MCPPPQPPQNTVPDIPVKSQAVPGSADYSFLTDLYHGEFPKVLIQLPMYNEDAHCDLIIQRCCKIKWPSHRLLIQVGTLLLAPVLPSMKIKHTRVPMQEACPVGETV